MVSTFPSQSAPAGSDIQAEVVRIATHYAGRPIAETLSAVKSYFTTRVFTAEHVQSASFAINRAIDADVLAQIKPIGSQIDDFTLPDADGQPVTLSALLSTGPVVVVFYRGEWCPYCNLHLGRFQQHLSEFKAAGASLIAISPQSPDHSLSVQMKNALSFPVLSDVESQVARLFGVVYQEPAEMAELHEVFGIHLSDFNGGDGETLPIPATFVLGKNRTVEWVCADFDYTTRSEPAEVVAVVKKLA